ncbi:MAG TPA: hypothetical protein VFY25_08235 [Anaerolineales bacterium]|nr:hypothetical protein [Anaerolineales bacterium]
MEFEPQDQEIVGLLTKLKNAEGQYPEHMFVARRQMYLRRMAEISMGIPADAGSRTAPKEPTPPPVTPATSTLLESALLLAILVEASAVAYFYRDQLSDFFETITNEPRVQEISPLPVVATSVEIQGITPSPASTATSPSATLAPSVSPTSLPATLPSTPVPGLADDNDGAGTSNTTTTGETTTNNSNTNPDTGSNQGGSTPAPNTNDNDDQGNHYGQTPKPERTIEPNNNSSNNDVPQDPATDDSKNNNGNNSNNGNSGNTNDTIGENPGSAPSDNPKPPKNK